MLEQVEQCIQFVKQYFPWIVKDNAISVNHNGSANIVIMVGDDEDHMWVFRFPRSNNESAKHQIKLEQKIMPVLAQQMFLPVPDYKYYSDVVGNNEIAYVAYRSIKGDPLFVESLYSLPPHLIAKTAKKLGCFLRKLHSFPYYRYFPEMSKTALMIRDNYMLRYQLIQEIVFPRLSQNERAWISHKFDTFLNNVDLWNFQTRFIHGDFKEDHILFDKNKGEITGIIDFGIQVNDPAKDFGFLLRYGDEFADQVLGCYGEDDVDIYFRERMKIYCQFMPFDALLYGAILQNEVSWNKGYEHFKKILMK